jgi:hypothetical protein
MPTVTAAAVNTLMGLELNCFQHQFYPYLEVKRVVWKGTMGAYKMFYVVLTDGEDDIVMDFHEDTRKKFISKIIGKKKTLIPGALVHLTMYYVKPDERVSEGRRLVVKNARVHKPKITNDLTR